MATAGCAAGDDGSDDRAGGDGGAGVRAGAGRSRRPRRPSPIPMGWWPGPSRRLRRPRRLAAAREAERNEVERPGREGRRASRLAGRDPEELREPDALEAAVAAAEPVVRALEAGARGGARDRPSGGRAGSPPRATRGRGGSAAQGEDGRRTGAPGVHRRHCRSIASTTADSMRRRSLPEQDLVAAEAGWPAPRGA